MIAAYEQIGEAKIIWGIARGRREARKIAAIEATRYHGEHISSRYFEVCEATPEMIRAFESGNITLWGREGVVNRGPHIEIKRITYNL